jgi:hypothetical protein
MAACDISHSKKCDWRDWLAGLPKGGPKNLVAEKLRSALATMVRAHHEIALGPSLLRRTTRARAGGGD